MSSPEPAADDGSFIHAARRRQLVQSAIDVIAEAGLARASTVRIAQRAGVSRGVLTYHFRDRIELLEQVVHAVYDLGAEVLGPPVAGAGSPREALLTFIAGSVELYAAYPRHMAALTEIYADAGTARSITRSRHPRHTREMSDLAEILRAGQARGQFRAFDVEIMCTTIRRALDGALAHVSAGGAAGPYAAELTATFDAATSAAAGNDRIARGEGP